MAGAPKLTLFSRDGCTLCDEMLEALHASTLASRCSLEVLDVDADPVTTRRYGHKVPVLLLDGDLVCHGALDADELSKALRLHDKTLALRDRKV